MENTYEIEDGKLKEIRPVQEPVAVLFDIDVIEDVLKRLNVSLEDTQTKIALWNMRKNKANELGISVDSN